jgi:hypothetical protein
MTTNFVEVACARAQPLVGIIEFFLYRTMKYFLDRANAAHEATQDPSKVYSTWMTGYLNKKQKAALSHRAYPQPRRILARKCSGNIR